MNVKIIDTSKGPVTLATIENSKGASVTLSSIGAGIVSVNVPDKNGVLSDVVIGYRNIEDYFYDGPCAGKTPGRFANRIAGGHLSVEGIDYQLAINNGPNALHGGPEGFQNKIWDFKAVDDNTVEFSLLSPDGDENYPGQLRASVRYEWNDDCLLTITMSAKTSAATVVNLTNHSYFNLDGHDSGSVLNHTLWLKGARWLPTDETLVPTGQIATVVGSPMDFTEAHTLGRDINKVFPALKYGKGYDGGWIIDAAVNGDIQHIATLAAVNSGRLLEVFTDQPAVQVYTGNWLTGSPKSKSGTEYHDYDAVAIECQDMPDAPNKPQFPSTLLKPGEKYCRHICFKFSAV